MRVIWISAGLMLVVTVVGFFLSEPGTESFLPSAQNTSQQAVVDNPFVEDAPSDSATAESISLAALPSSTGLSPDAETVPAQPSQQRTTDDSIAKVNSAPETKTAPESETIVASALSKTAIPAVDPVATQNQQATAEKPEKKLGLSMLALEKEKKKNKVAVIVHQNNNNELSENEIKALYLDRLTRWQDGSKVMLYNLPLGDKYRDKFSESILKMSALEADRHESRRRQLHIKVNDVEVKAKNVVISYVEQHPNAVAYVPLNLVREKSNVKVVLTIP